VIKLRTGRLGFHFGQEAGIISLRHRVQTGAGAHPASPGVKRQGREAGHSPPSSVRG